MICSVCSNRRFTDVPFELYEEKCWKCSQELPSMYEHTDDAHIHIFTHAMRSKLKRKREEGRSGWDDKDQCSQEFLSQLLREHVEKGDPVDVANFCMMLHQRGERIKSSALK